MATKSDIIEKVIKRNSFLSKEIVIAVVDRFLEILSDALQDHNRIEIRGFASFSIRSYNLEEVGRSTPTQFKRSRYPKVYFRSSKDLSSLVNK